jgi:hypothetical protein
MELRAPRCREVIRIHAADKPAQRKALRAVVLFAGLKACASTLSELSLAIQSETLLAVTEREQKRELSVWFAFDELEIEERFLVCAPRRAHTARRKRRGALLGMTARGMWSAGASTPARNIGVPGTPACSRCLPPGLCPGVLLASTHMHHFCHTRSRSNRNAGRGRASKVIVAARPGKPGRQTAAASRRTPHGTPHD